VLAKLNAGSSFESLAQKFSLSPEGSSGGSLGWQDAASSQQAAGLLQQPLGLVKKVVPGPGGFYIFKILELKKPTPQSFSQVKDALKKTILEKKKNEAYVRWLEEQVKTVKVLSNERLIRTITSHYQETL
ncbi:peptidylprolyl isomerase, partial [bacterium]|nr:peptidylprolyl isomerase [bacterium]